MNTYYSIVIETYFIWSWARNASFCSLKNLNSTAVCGTAILKALQNDLPYKFCFWPFKNFKCGNKDEFMITFSSQCFKQQKRSFPFLKVMSSLWILLPNNNSNSCSIYTSKFCDMHLFDGNPLPTLSAYCTTAGGSFTDEEVRWLHRRRRFMMILSEVKLQNPAWRPTLPQTEALTGGDTRTVHADDLLVEAV